MNYYKQGDAANADQIKAAFEAKGFNTLGINFDNKTLLYFSFEGHIKHCSNDWFFTHLIKTHPDYQELKLPIEPKFKAEDRIVSKSDKSTIYRIITLHEEHREYIVEIEHKDYHESCPWIAFEDQDDYELAPKPHYDSANFKPFDKVLVRDADDGKWVAAFYSHYMYEEKDYPYQFATIGTDIYGQCIPFNDDTKHLFRTTDMPSEEYINW